MRILTVGHTYIVAENRKKLEALADLPGVELAVVVPRSWRDPLQGTLQAQVPAQARFSTFALPAMWTGHEQFYWYRSADMAIGRFQPDILYVEQGAGSFVYTQALLARQRFAQRTKAVFFTWWNLPYHARWPLSAIEGFNLRHSQGAVAGNADAAAILREHGFTGPMTVLPQLGVDTVAFARRDATERREALKLTRFTVGFVGRIVEEKGIRVLLGALSGAPFDFQLLIVGGGPLAADARATAAAQGWGDRLTIVDFVAHEEVPHYLSCMDVLVLPTLDRPFCKEQFGHVLIEAMASEVAVVGSRCGEIPYTIEDAGVVVAQGDTLALRAAIGELADSAERRRELGARGRRRVLERFTHTRIAEQLHTFLTTL